MNGYSGILGETLGLSGTSLGGIQRQGFRGFGHEGQTDSGDGSAT
ncbi:MAG: hypothetical protein ACREC3_15740 [Methyloceanibacter sp.]